MVTDHGCANDHYRILWDEREETPVSRDARCLDADFGDFCRLDCGDADYAEGLAEDVMGGGLFWNVYS